MVVLPLVVLIESATEINCRKPKLVSFKKIIGSEVRAREFLVEDLPLPSFSKAPFPEALVTLL